MTVNDYIKFPGGTQDKGVNNFEPALGAEITWTKDANNVTSGIRRGVGPRYGMAPLAGHSNTETPAGNETNGIQRSEITTGSVGLTHREMIYGIVPITMAGYDGAWPKANQQFYCYLVGLDDTANVTIDACLGATLASSVNKQSSTLVAGLAQSSYRQESPLVRLHKTEMLNLPLTATPTAADMQAILRQTSSSVSGSQVNQFWAPWSHISVSGKRVPYFWMFADTTSTPDATTAPSLNLWSKTVSVGTNATILGGSPSEIITREFFSNNQRELTVYCLDDDGYAMDLGYTKQITQANTASVPAYGTGNNYSSLTTATKFGASVAYSSVQCALILDSGSYTNSRHEAVLFAGIKPFAVIYQDWLQAVKGMMPRWVDLTNPACIPRNGLSSFSGYRTPVPNPSSYLDAPSAGVITAQALDSDTGFLRVGNTYDIGFSYYNKLLDYETNVSYCFSVGSDIDDDFGVALVTNNTATNNIFEVMVAFSAVSHPWEYSDTAAVSGYPTGRGFHINDFEIRFYYKESGPGEWLPAGSFDAAQFWFGTWTSAPLAGAVANYSPTICRQAVGSTIGGQPNGFVDYSPLPNQQYICTTVFQQRAFWWSEKSMHFSYGNNIYAYPTRNIVAAPTGKWRGGIVHIRQNVANQQSRLIVFGDNTYSARFTGQRYVQNVRVSADSVGQFEVDGSDFVMDYLCDATAFSYRSACVAEGVLYFWGPQGVYMDDGAIPQPLKISGGLEPEISDYVDMGRCAEIHCVYSKRTSEVIWFYPPKVTDATHPTYILVYNVETKKFYPGKIRCQVDSSQNIKIENDSTPDGVDGERILLHCRASTAATVQRTFYFDDLVQAGEQGPTTELTVLSFTSPTTSTRTLTLAAGSIGITAGSIVANGYLSFNNAKGYAPGLTLATDMIAKITGVDNGASTITIELPTGASWDASATLTGQTAFPVYYRAQSAIGLHGISYNIPTNYWLPNGVSSAYIWQYLYFLFKYAGIPTPLDPLSLDEPGGPYSLVSKFDLTYRTMVCDAALTDTIPFKNNSAGMFQRHHQLRNEGRAANGQALSYTLSGIYIGDPWTLQYLEAHCLLEKGFTLKEFAR